MLIKKDCDIRLDTYLTNCISYPAFGAVCRIRLASFGFEQALQPLSDMTLCVCLNSQLQNHWLELDVLHIQ